MRRLRYLTVSPRTPQRIAHGLTGLIAVAGSGTLLAGLVSGSISHVLAAGVVTVGEVLAQ